MEKQKIENLEKQDAELTKEIKKVGKKIDELNKTASSLKLANNKQQSQQKFEQERVKESNAKETKTQQERVKQAKVKQAKVNDEKENFFDKLKKKIAVSKQKKIDAKKEKERNEEYLPKTYDIKKARLSPLKIVKYVILGAVFLAFSLATILTLLGGMIVAGVSGLALAVATGSTICGEAVSDMKGLAEQRNQNVQTAQELNEKELEKQQNLLKDKQKEEEKVEEEVFELPKQTGAEKDEVAVSNVEQAQTPKSAQIKKPNEKANLDQEQSL